MKTRILLLFGLGVLLFPPTLASSDCTDLGRSTGVSVLDDKTIVYYVGNQPLAQIVLQDCTVNASSNIRLLKNYVCDSDRVVVDGQECAIMTLTLGSAP